MTSVPLNTKGDSRIMQKYSYCEPYVRVALFQCTGQVHRCVGPNSSTCKMYSFHRVTKLHRTNLLSPPFPRPCQKWPWVSGCVCLSSPPKPTFTFHPLCPSGFQKETVSANYYLGLLTDRWILADEFQSLCWLSHFKLLISRWRGKVLAFPGAKGMWGISQQVLWFVCSGEGVMRANLI